MAELVGTRALARLLGVSPAAVTKAVREGRLTPTEIVDGRPMFDPEEARNEWRPDVAPPPVEGDDGDDTDTDDNARYRKARADKEEAVAAQETLALEQMRGNLLPREEVSLSFTQFLRVANQALSGLPAKMFSRYPGMTQAGRDFLFDELRAVLDSLAEWEAAE